jgi:hypothetical protein
VQQPKEKGEQWQACKNAEPQITMTPLQIAKEWLPEEKGRSLPEKKRYLDKASEQEHVVSHGTRYKSFPAAHSSRREHPV